MKITKDQHAILVGTLLGDGTLERNGKYVRLRIEHGLRQKQYLFWKYRALKPFITKPPRTVVSYQRIAKRAYKRLHFSTYSLAQLEPYWNAFYPHGKKRITELVCKWLRDPVSLAVWFMDDGSIKSKKHKGVFLNTQGFTKNDILKLQKALEQNFGIKSTTRMDKNRQQIYLGGTAGEKFCALINPYVIPSMRYKIPQSLRLTELPKE